MTQTRIHVLLVDDDEEDFLITSGVIAEISGTNYEVTWKDAYRAALDAMELHSFDVIVLDYRLGAETGIDLLKEVIARKYPAPVILLTGQADHELDNEAIRLGAADYLIKGRITPDSFERAVRHAITQHRVLTQLHSANAFLQSIIDALTSEVAILDAAGRVFAINRAWRDSFAAAGGVLAASGIGESFLDWPARAPVEEKAAAEALVTGIRCVMRDEQPLYSMECPLTSNGRCRWVIARVSSFMSNGAVFAVVAYEDITMRKLFETQLENSRARLEALSVRDELTSLNNRRYLNSALEQEIGRARRNSESFAVLLLDIDHFKSVNDTHGHQVGDVALRHIARVCRACARTGDVVARYGGEEIAFVLPQTGKEAAMEAAERIRKAIEADAMEIAGAVALKLTASIGVAIFPACGDTAEQLFVNADAGLYHAKRNGRNQVCFHAI